VAVNVSYASKCASFHAASRGESEPPISAVFTSLIHMLERRSWDGLRPALARYVDEPTATIRPPGLPRFLLAKALAVALLGQSPVPFLADAREAVPLALASVSDERLVPAILDVAVAVCAWTRDPALAAWVAKRRAFGPSHPIGDTALLVHAHRAMEGEPRAPSPSGPAAMLAIAARRMLLESRRHVAATLLAHGASCAPTALAEGRRLVDDDLFPSGDPYHARATYTEPSWRWSKGALSCRVSITGSGAVIRAVAPFLEPAYQIVGDLDRFARGELERGEIEDGRSKPHVMQLLADPANEVVLHYAQGSDAYIDSSAFAPYQHVLDVVSEWLRARHGRAFAPRIRLSADLLQA
jgi:hypothetical protein